MGTCHIHVEALSYLCSLLAQKEERFSCGKRPAKRLTQASVVNGKGSVEASLTRLLFAALVRSFCFACCSVYSMNNLVLTALIREAEQRGERDTS